MVERREGATAGRGEPPARAVLRGATGKIRATAAREGKVAARMGRAEQEWCVVVAWKGEEKGAAWEAPAVGMAVVAVEARAVAAKAAAAMEEKAEAAVKAWEMAGAPEKAMVAAMVAGTREESTAGRMAWGMPDLLMGAAGTGREVGRAAVSLGTAIQVIRVAVARCVAH
jgi:hypothetical protein